MTIYASQLAMISVYQKNFDVSEWQTLIPYLSFFTSLDPDTVDNKWAVNSASAEN